MHPNLEITILERNKTLKPAKIDWSGSGGVYHFLSDFEFTVNVKLGDNLVVTLDSIPGGLRIDVTLDKKPIIINAGKEQIGESVIIPIRQHHGPPPRKVRLSPLRKIGHVSSIGVTCGIATYLEGLLDAMIPLSGDLEHVAFGEDPPAIDDRVRTHEGYPKNMPKLFFSWSRDDTNFDRLFEALKRENIDLLHIQHEWSFFGYDNPVFYDLLYKTKAEGIVNVLTWHTVMGPEEGNPNLYRKLFHELADLVDLNIVHNPICFRNLMYWGVPREKIRLVTMWAYPLKKITQKDARRKMLPKEYWDKTLIVTGGFLQPNKGVIELMMATSALNRSDLAIICVGGSHPWSPHLYENYRKQCVQAAKQLCDVHFDYRFLSDKDASLYLTCADVIVLNYCASLSGISGWGRRCLASQRPLIVTDIRLFQDLTDHNTVLKIPPKNTAELVKALDTLLTDKKLAARLVANATRFAHGISPQRQAEKHIKTYKEIYSKCQAAPMLKSLLKS